MSKKIKVLYVIGSLDIGGAERHLVQVIPAMQGMGISTAVFTVNHRGIMAADLEGKGIPVVSPYFSDALNVLPAFFKIPLLIISSSLRYVITLWRIRPDFIHFFLPQAYIFGCLLSFFYWPVVRVMSRRSLNLYQLRHPFLARIEYFLHQRVDVVLGNSLAVCNELVKEGVDVRKLGLIYNGVGTSQFLGIKPKGFIRRNLEIPDETLMLVMVANLIPYKGHLDLLEALAYAQSKLPTPWKMVFVGRDVGIKNQLQLRAVELDIADSIIWLGARADATSIAGAADIGILSSHEEGFSNSILEAMFLGTAMIVTRVGGNAEAVIDRVSGLVVSPRKPKELGDAIISLANSATYRQLLSSNAKRRANKYFSLDICSQRYFNLYSGYRGDKSNSVEDIINTTLA